MKRPYSVALLTWLVVGAALVGGGGPLPTPVLAQSESEGWTTLAPMPLPRSEISVAQANGRLFVLGGYPGARITSDAVQVYDPETDSWELGPPLPLPLHHTMAASVDERLYIIGGEAGNPSRAESLGFQSSVFMLDEQAGQWLPRAPMPTARSGGGAAVIDGKIYVAGGRPPRGHDFAVYDPLADQWTVLPDLPTQRNHLGVAAIDGRVYVAGGRFGGGVGSEMTDVLEIYDPGTNAWTSGTSLLSPRAGVAAVAANGCLYVIGGEGNDADPRGIFDQNEMYDPSTGAWRSLPPLPVPIHGLTGAGFMNGLIYIPGGATHRGVSGANVTLDLQVYRANLTCGPASG
jgi:N-acetylneuraminic acid mutarotase